ncbi:MAG: DUF177 domain-containing protein [Defluviitaleaceae bacterium]|nr:DUF177 domain-containing protein [Defluviitaleaceae bacterium]
MVIDISRLTNNKPIKINSQMTIGSIGLNLEKSNPVLDIKGNISKQDNIFFINVRVSSILSFLCDFCLKPLDFKVDFSIDEKFIKKIGEDKKKVDKEISENDILWIDENSISITPLCIANILECVPMQTLCNKNCKGMCYICGTNLNDDSCTCKQEKNTDSRFDILKSLKFQNN